MSDGFSYLNSLLPKCSPFAAHALGALWSYEVKNGNTPTRAQMDEVARIATEDDLRFYLQAWEAGLI